MGKKKASYFKNPKKSSQINIPPKGSRGILVTCDVDGSRKALDQVTRLINELADPIEESPEDEQQNEQPIEQQTEKPTEQAQESTDDNPDSNNSKNENKNRKPRARFVPYMSEVNGNFFIRFTNEKDDPFIIVEKYFNTLKETGVSLTRNATRMYPIQASGFPTSEETIPVLEPFVRNFFRADGPPISYEIIIQRKHKGSASGESHDDLNKKLLALVGPPHHASFHKGDAAVLWISLGRNLYVSVVPKWREWCGCNIPKCAAQKFIEKVEEKVEKKEDEKKEDTPAETA
ncbi:hypothetical protein TRFO_16418 [Tritrichomonas foetus]|uniref:THUMP domain-containing protein n=1 Tax=Tritrichomonas foetus TaxID=1144522 RepID=A0A1J4KR75_9EUKA|nr:hypothetical protein TRFO_16418 [Tritrichomonas foetus]|eukprot:OHT13432.1 hypothetical protein TRFO_16418 [Tritrichomonas foetus]